MGRLNDGQGSELPKADLRAWCEEQNARPITARMSRWYFVAEADGIRRVDCLEGTDGENVRKLVAGRLADFAGWPEKRMAGYRRWLWNCAMNGLTPDSARQVGRPQMEDA